MKPLLVGLAATAVIGGSVIGVAWAYVALGWIDDASHAWLFATVCGIVGGIAAARRCVVNGNVDWRKEFLGIRKRVP